MEASCGQFRRAYLAAARAAARNASEMLAGAREQLEESQIGGDAAEIARAERAVETWERAEATANEEVGRHGASR